MLKEQKNSKYLTLKRVDDKYFIAYENELILSCGLLNNLNLNEEENNVNVNSETNKMQKQKRIYEYEITNKMREYFKLISLNKTLFYLRKSLLSNYKSIIQKQTCSYSQSLEIEDLINLNTNLINHNINKDNIDQQKKKLDIGIQESHNKKREIEESQTSEENNLTQNSMKENEKDQYLSSYSEDDEDEQNQSSDSDFQGERMKIGWKYMHDIENPNSDEDDKSLNFGEKFKRDEEKKLKQSKRKFFWIRRYFERLIQEYIKLECRYSSVFELLKTNNQQIDELEELFLQILDKGDFSMTILNPFIINIKELRIIHDYLIYFDFISKAELPNLSCSKYQNLLKLLQDNNSKISVKWTVLNICDHNFYNDKSQEGLYSYEIKANCPCGQSETIINCQRITITQIFCLNLIETENIHILLNPFILFTEIQIKINFHTDFRVVRIYETYWRQNYPRYSSELKYRHDNIKREQIELKKLKYLGLNNEELFQISIPSISLDYNHIRIGIYDHLLQDITLLVLIAMDLNYIQNQLNFNLQNLIVDLLIC